MMRRLNQFQVSELFPLLIFNLRRHTVEEVQKEVKNYSTVRTF